MRVDTTSREFFEHKYQQRADPWEFASSEYEKNRYAAIFDALKHRNYDHAFEPGCSIGVLTERLASISKRVDAIDISPTAVKHARNRCKTFPNVEISCGSLVNPATSESFDLVVLSEIGYYFEEEKLRTVGEKLVSQIRKSGVLLAAHWLGTSEDHLLSGDRVHEILGNLTGLSLEHSERHTGFRLDCWGRV